jgi:hypothetical protein
MHKRKLYPNDEPAFICLRSEDRKYSKEWWEHVNRSTMSDGTPQDPLVIKLIDEYESTQEGYEELKTTLEGIY